MTRRERPEAGMSALELQCNHPDQSSQCGVFFIVTELQPCQDVTKRLPSASWRTRLTDIQLQYMRQIVDALCRDLYENSEVKNRPRLLAFEKMEDGVSSDLSAGKEPPTGWLESLECRAYIGVCRTTFRSS